MDLSSFVQDNGGSYKVNAVYYVSKDENNAETGKNIIVVDITGELNSKVK